MENTTMHSHSNAQQEEHALWAMFGDRIGAHPSHHYAHSSVSRRSSDGSAQGRDDDLSMRHNAPYAPYPYPGAGSSPTESSPRDDTAADEDDAQRLLKRQRNTEASKRFRLNKKAREASREAHRKEVAALRADKAALETQVRMLLHLLRAGDEHAAQRYAMAPAYADASTSSARSSHGSETSEV